MTRVEARWRSWDSLREEWESIRRSWGLPKTYATAGFFYDFFHNLPHLSVEVLILQAGARTLALFPVAVRKRLGVFMEGHAMPWSMPGGVWISPAVPDNRRMEILKEVRKHLRRFGYFTFLDRFGTVGLAWEDLPARELVHHVLPAGAPPRSSALRTIQKAREHYTTRGLGPEDLDGLYPVYVEFQKSKRSPHLDRVFFETFFQMIPETTRIALGLVRDSAWAGGLLGMGDGEEALLFLIFLDSRARKEGGFHLLVQEAAELAQKRGHRRVDLGHHPGKNPGLDFVKSHLGAEEERVLLRLSPTWMFALRGAGNRVWYRRRVRP